MINNTLPDITGLILVGGKSRRMGQDKAFLKLDQTILLDRLLNVLSQCFEQNMLVGNRFERFAAYDIPLIEDIYPGSSLGGLYSGLHHAKTGYVFVVPCDLAFPNPAVIRYLCSLKNTFDAVVPTLSHGFETLCALYSKSCLAAMETMLKSGNHRIFDLYPQLNVRAVPYAELSNFDHDASAFLSANTPEEFENIKTWMPEGNNGHNQ